MVWQLPTPAVLAIRAGEPFRSRHPQTGQDFFSTPVEQQASAFRPTCRACNCVLDKSTPVLMIEAFARNAPYQARKPTKLYLHRDDCTQPGFVQTMGFAGQAPGLCRVAVTAEPDRPTPGAVERRYNQTPELITLPTGEQFVGYRLEPIPQGTTP